MAETHCVLVNRNKTNLMLSLLFNYFRTFVLCVLVIIAQSEKARAQVISEDDPLVCSENDSFGVNKDYDYACLMVCSHKGDEYCISQLLDSGVNVDTSGDDDDNYPPLILATDKNHYNSVALLLSRGANVNLQTSSGITALLIAAQKGHEAIAALLLDNGADPDLQTNTGIFPLVAAARFHQPGCVALLLKQGANVHLQSYSGHTPLSGAAASGCDTCIELLLNSDATIDFQDKNGNTPLFEAAFAGHENCVVLLLNAGAKADLQNKAGQSPLFAAAHEGHKGCLEHLLRSGATVDLQNGFGHTSLYEAATGGHQGCVETLLRNNATVDLQAKDGESPLLIAAYQGHERCVELLLSYGATVDIRNERENTALHKAVEKGYENIVELLIHRGANIHQQNSLGDTPLTQAIKQGDTTLIIKLTGSVADCYYFSLINYSPVVGLGCVKEYLDFNGAIMTLPVVSAFTLFLGYRFWRHRASGAAGFKKKAVKKPGNRISVPHSHKPHIMPKEPVGMTFAEVGHTNACDHPPLTGHLDNERAIIARLGEVVRNRLGEDYKKDDEIKKLITALVNYIDQFGFNSENILPNLNPPLQNKIVRLFKEAGLTMKSLTRYDQSGKIKSVFKDYLEKK